MTVKCLTPEQKTAVVELYQLHTPPTAIAVMFRRSYRTIIRVLEEFGVAPVKKAQPLIPRMAPSPQLSLFKQPTAYQLFKASWQAIRIKPTGAAYRA
jgi:hypothetical protein